ncbi:MAG: hypothetical protein U1E65_03425 [Myxococcota bacterium]
MTQTLSTLVFGFAMALTACGGPIDDTEESNAPIVRSGADQLVAFDQALDLGFAAPPNTAELHCTSSGGHHTCTSAYAWVCPEGWSACRLSPGVKTCCTK